MINNIKSILCDKQGKFKHLAELKRYALFGVILVVSIGILQYLFHMLQGFLHR